MTDYKLVPVEPTAEMLCKGMEAYCIEDCEVIAQGHVLGIYKAMLSATPAVQGEPENWREKVADLIKVAHGEGQKSATGRDPSSFRWVNSKSYKAAQALLAAPTPEAVQGEPVGWVWHSYNQTNFTSGSHHKEVLEADGVKLTPVYTAPQPAEQQPEPDVEALVEALSIARDYVFSSLEEKKLALAGYPQMWRCEQDDLAMIDATMSAYRKETSHDK